MRDLLCLGDWARARGAKAVFLRPPFSDASEKANPNRFVCRGLGGRRTKAQHFSRRSGKRSGHLSTKCHPVCLESGIPGSGSLSVPAPDAHADQAHARITELGVQDVRY
jgi:hypothetical protein